MRLNLNLLTPCLIFRAVVLEPSVRDPATLATAVWLGFAGVGLGYLAGRLLTRLLGWPDPVQRRTLAYVVGLQNYGFLPIPIAVAMFDGAVLAKLFPFTLGVEFSMWALAATVSPGATGRVPWRKMLNGPLLAMFGGIAANYAGLGSHLPVALDRTLAWLGACCIPMALLLVGAILSEELEELLGRPAWGVLAAALVVRAMIVPPLAIGLAWLCTRDPALRAVALIEAAMPCAMFPAVLVRFYGGDTRTALTAIVGTTLAGLVTIPLWLLTSLHFLATAWHLPLLPAIPGTGGF